MKTPTSHFTTVRNAIAFYQAQGNEDAAALVQAHLSTGAITIGTPPAIVDGEQSLIDKCGRYWVVSGRHARSASVA